MSIDSTARYVPSKTLPSEYPVSQSLLEGWTPTTEPRHLLIMNSTISTAHRQRSVRPTDSILVARMKHELGCFCREPWLTQWLHRLLQTLQACRLIREAIRLCVRCYCGRGRTRSPHLDGEGLAIFGWQGRLCPGNEAYGSCWAHGGLPPVLPEIVL